MVNGLLSIVGMNYGVGVAVRVDGASPTPGVDVTDSPGTVEAGDTSSSASDAQIDSPAWTMLMIVCCESA